MGLFWIDYLLKKNLFHQQEIPDVDVHESESDDGRHEETPQQSTPKKGVVYIDYDDFVTTKMKEDLNW